MSKVWLSGRLTTVRAQKFGQEVNLVSAPFAIKGLRQNTMIRLNGPEAGLPSR